MIQLQEMLLQTDGDLGSTSSVLAYDVDVSFRLHVRGNTVVECHYQGGTVKNLSVTPKARKEDVEFLI